MNMNQLTVLDEHPAYGRKTLERACRWIAREIGMTPETLRRLTVRVALRRCRGRRYNGGDTWGGWYYPDRRMVVATFGDGITYPSKVGHNLHEEERVVHDEWECVVHLLAHELEHARAYAVCKTDADLRRLNHEPRVRAVAWRVALRFRSDRDSLVPQWAAEPKRRPRPEKPVVSAVDRRAARAAELLAQWERRMKLARTKVAKYRRRVTYYKRRAATSKPSDPPLV